MSRIAIIAAGLSIACFANIASANQFRFSYSEKDFSSPQAVAALHQRIKSTARNYCGKQFSKTRHLYQYGSCVTEVISELTDGIDAGRRFADTSDPTRQDS